MVDGQPIKIVYVKTNATGRAMTVEELKGRRKTIAISMLETLYEEHERKLMTGVDDVIFVQRNQQDVMH